MAYWLIVDWVYCGLEMNGYSKSKRDHSSRNQIQQVEEAVGFSQSATDRYLALTEHGMKHTLAEYHGKAHNKGGVQLRITPELSKD